MLIAAAGDNPRNKTRIGERFKTSAVFESFGVRGQLVSEKNEVERQLRVGSYWFSFWQQYNYTG